MTYPNPLPMPVAESRTILTSWISPHLAKCFYTSFSSMANGRFPTNTPRLWSRFFAPSDAKSTRITKSSTVEPFNWI